MTRGAKVYIENETEGHVIETCEDACQCGPANFACLGMPATLARPLKGRASVAGKIQTRELAKNVRAG